MRLLNKKALYFVTAKKAIKSFCEVIDKKMLYFVTAKKAIKCIL